MVLLNQNQNVLFVIKKFHELGMYVVLENVREYYQESNSYDGDINRIDERSQPVIIGFNSLHHL